MHEEGIIYNLYSTDEKWVKVVITIALTFAWTCLGFFTELLGPSLKTLMHQLDTDYGGIGQALSIRSIGFFTGSLFGGLVADIYNHYLHLFIVISLLLAALSTAIIPFCVILSQFSSVLFIGGIAHGFLSSAGNPLISHSWRQKASGPFNLMHSGYGVGGALTALVIKCFNQTSTSGYLNITAPFLISTLASLLMAVPFALLFIRHNLLRKKTLRLETMVHLEKYTKEDEMRIMETSDKARVTENKRCTRFFSKLVFYTKLWMEKAELKKPYLIIFIVVIYFCLMGNERVASKFLYSYIESGEHGTDQSDALLVQSAFWGVYCLGRIIVFILTFKINITILFTMEILGALVSSSCLAFGPRKKLMGISFTILFAAFKSPLFPSTMGVFSQVCRITGFVVLFVDIGSSFGGAFYQYIAARIIQAYTIAAFPYILFVTVLVIVPFSLLLNFIVYRETKEGKVFKDIVMH